MTRRENTEVKRQRLIAETFSMGRQEGSRWCLRRTRSAMGFECHFGNVALRVLRNRRGPQRPKGGLCLKCPDRTPTVDGNNENLSGKTRAASAAQRLRSCRQIVQLARVGLPADQRPAANGLAWAGTLSPTGSTCAFLSLGPAAVFSPWRRSQPHAASRSGR